MSWGKFWDTSAFEPKVLSVTPVNGATNLSVFTPIIVTFDKDMDASGITTASAGTSCSGSFQVSADNFSTCLPGTLSFPSLRQVSFLPSGSFCVESQYSLSLRIQPGVKSLDGFSLVSAYIGTLGFSTQQALLKVGVTAGTNVYALLVGCNTLYVGGAFTQVGGVARNNLAAIDLTTGFLNNFDSTNFSTVGAINALALDGSNLIVGGVFTTVGNAVAAPYLAQFSTLTGFPNSSWNVALNATVNSIAVENGKIYVAGNFTSASCGARNRLALFTAASNVCDATWNPGSSAATVSAIAVSAGNVYVGGSFSGGSVGGVITNFFAAVSASGIGTGNSGFCTGANITGAAVSAIAVRGGLVFAGGGFNPGFCGPNFYGLGAVDAISGAPFGFPSGAGAGASGILALNASDTTLYVGGSFTGASSFFSNPRNFAGATDLMGNLRSWDPNLNGNVTAIANVGSAVFLGGTFTTANGGTVVNRLTLVDANSGVVRP